jgi:hypothetical protein
MQRSRQVVAVAYPPNSLVFIRIRQGHWQDPPPQVSGSGQVSPFRQDSTGANNLVPEKSTTIPVSTPAPASCDESGTMGIHRVGLLWVLR